MQCKNCGGENVQLLDGRYICQECHLEFEELLEEQNEDKGSKCNRRNLIHSADKRRKKKVFKSKPIVCDWTTFEAFNFILHKQVSALIELGASKHIKNAVLFIWSKYLQKCEVAFKEDESQPKLSHSPTKRDLQALYGSKILYNWNKWSSTIQREKKVQEKVEVKKEVKSDCETDYESTGQNESEGEVDTPMEVDDIKIAYPMLSAAARENFRKKKNSGHTKPSDMPSKQKKMSCMTMSKTVCFLHLGLMICKDLLSLSDLIRLMQEGRIPYINVVSIFPSHMKLHRTDLYTFDTIVTPSLNEVTVTSSKLVEFLEISELVQKRPIMPIVARFVKDLNLPVSVVPIVKILVDKWHERMNAQKNSKKSREIQAEEVKASAFILVALKTLFILDGKYENEHSDAMTKLNILLKEKRMFVWKRWQRQAQLKEYLFMKDGIQYSSMTTLDKLNVDQILAKYPIVKLRMPDAPEPGENLHYRRHYMSYSSRHNIAKMMSTAAPADNILLFETSPTSFPLSQPTEVFPRDWPKYPFYFETDQMDTTFLEEDFSRDLLFLRDEDQEENELAKMLISPLYKETEYTYLLKQRSSFHDVLKTSSDYWFKHLKTRNNKAPRSLETDWMGLLPPSFQWLLKFMCKYVRVSSPDLYHMMFTIEREVHLQLGCLLKDTKPGPLHVDRLQLVVPSCMRKPRVYK